MYEYKHGGNAIFEKGGTDILDLSANINPLGLPRGVAEAIQDAIRDCTSYPDHRALALREKIADFEGVPKDCIYCGNGASDIIFRLALALKPEKVFLPAPTFADYERAVRPFSREIIYHDLSEHEGFAIGADMAREILKNKTDLLFLCNPNNPTGLLTKKEVLESVLDAAKEAGTYVVIDECFMDFTEEPEVYTAKPLLTKYKNLIILRAFTKIFALPGVRLGYVLCADGDMVDKLQYHGADWAVSNLAQAAGIAALQNAPGYIKQTVDFISVERDYIKTELRLLGFTVFDSSANYIFFKNPYPFDLWERLNEIGIRIRVCHDFRGLSGAYCRMGISSHAFNVKFVQAVKEVLA